MTPEFSKVGQSTDNSHSVGTGGVVVKAFQLCLDGNRCEKGNIVKRWKKKKIWGMTRKKIKYLAR